MRVLGLDLGTKRIGVATSDRSGTLASPLVVLSRSGDRRRDHEAIRKLVEDEEAEAVIVGLPLSLDGSVGRAAEGAIAEAAEIASVVGVPVDTYDERLTTVTADRDLMALRMRAEARRRVVDKVAAAVMLQSWLDSRTHREPSPLHPPSLHPSSASPTSSSTSSSTTSSTASSTKGSRS